MSDPAPAQQVIVNEQIDWATVERRLERFPAIARAFLMDRDGSSRPPVYCRNARRPIQSSSRNMTAGWSSTRLSLRRAAEAGRHVVVMNSVSVAE